MRYAFIYLLSITSISLYGQSGLNRLFTGENLRLDYVLTGNDSETRAYFYKLSKEMQWTGSPDFKDPFINGNYYFEILDPVSDSVIFTRSFDTLFGEWQTTLEARSMSRAFQQTLYFPCPKKDVLFRLFKRKDRHTAEILLEVTIDPDDFLIPVKKKIPDYMQIQMNGEPENKTDLLFIAEGYTSEEKEKFLSDVHRFTEYLFSIDPFEEQRGNFNILALHPSSFESGTSIPGEFRWIDTPVKTSFYTFGSERYLTSPDYWKICDLIENVPHDHILILVNTDKYGGGGIYNHFSIFSSNHPLSEIVFVHELGHGFAGLGDEYYDSEVAYENFYPLDSEPLPPNLTTLVNFGLKWKDMISDEMPVPTPAIEKYKGKVGVFEGGGYVSQGIFRPQQECRMKSNDAPEFCKVCQRAIRQMIDHYSD